MKNSFKNLTIIVLILAVAGCSNYPVKNNHQLINYEYGIFETEIVDEEYAKNHVAKKRLYLSKTVHLKQTRNIPAKIGIAFGLTYELPKELIGELIKVKTIVTFPEEGLTNPATNETGFNAELSDNFILNPSDPKESTLYIFEQGWEAVPGKWKFEVYLNNIKYIEEIFTVTSST